MLKAACKATMVSLTWLLLLQPASGNDSLIPFSVTHPSTPGRDSFLDCLVNSAREDTGLFQPDGVWSPEFKDVSSGLTAYKTDFGPHFGISKKGDQFASTQYFPERAQELNHLSSLQIALVNTKLQVNGGAMDQTRDFNLKQLSNGRIRAEPTQLSLQEQIVTPGCSLKTGVGERFEFDPQSSHIITYVVADIQILENLDLQSNSCTSYLNQLGQNIQNGSAPQAFQTLSQTHSLDVSNIQNLVEADIFYLFDAKRVG